MEGDGEKKTWCPVFGLYCARFHPQKNETDSRNERKPWALKSLKEMKGDAFFKIKKCACLTC